MSCESSWRDVEARKNEWTFFRVFRAVHLASIVIWNGSLLYFEYFLKFSNSSFPSLTISCLCGNSNSHSKSLPLYDTWNVYKCVTSQGKLKFPMSWQRKTLKFFFALFFILRNPLQSNLILILFDVAIRLVCLEFFMWNFGWKLEQKRKVQHNLSVIFLLKNIFT